MVGPYRPSFLAPRARGGVSALVRGPVLALATLLIVACGGNTPEPFSDLGSVGELQARFNRDAGKARVVLLLSPT